MITKHDCGRRVIPALLAGLFLVVQTTDALAQRGGGWRGGGFSRQGAARGGSFGGSEARGFAGGEGGGRSFGAAGSADRSQTAQSRQATSTANQEQRQQSMGSNQSRRQSTASSNQSSRQSSVSNTTAYNQAHRQSAVNAYGAHPGYYGAYPAGGYAVAAPYGYNYGAAAATTAVVAGTAAAAGAAAASQRAYATLPCSAAPVAVGNVTYFQCGAHWYTPVYVSGGVNYVISAPPAGY